MIRSEGRALSSGTQLEKSQTGIKGLDEVTRGGLPKGRPTLICGGPGSGKTLLASEFLVRGALKFGEPGVFMSFEETSDDLTKNVASLGFKLDDLVAEKMIFLDYVLISRSEIEETGEYDLEGLFIRLEYAIASVGAKRVVLDSIETLFAGIPNPALVRAEIKRLFQWLKNKGMTTIITGEQGEKTFTRHGLEEYVSDCVIFLDHRISDQVSTRRIRIVKYRGSAHDTNEFPFLINENGITVMPITSLGLRHIVTNERISTGIPRLDAMLGEKGYYRASSVLISGSAGTGKTSFASHFADAACRRGEKCLFFAFEESESQVIRNMRSIGIDLEQWVKNGLLIYHADRPTIYGLETHLSVMQEMINEFNPRAVIVDPVSNLNAVANNINVKMMLTRLLDQLKLNSITTVLTILTQGSQASESTDVDISSLADTWIRLRDTESGGERTRGMYILKSRGMPHSNQVREFLLTDKGVDIMDVYVGPEGFLTGSARVFGEAQEKAKDAALEQDAQMKERILERKRKEMKARITEIRAEFKTQEAAIKESIRQEKLRQNKASENRDAMAHIRKAN
ncbi:MAG: KaiC 1 [Deltaproteobacteria bacterium CG23_combo_of_CG06-09_8_20_14_all_51_20]|nr:circadian clock protein KaiC [Deltaproteobacteria bacterium]PIP47403.1 MAG: KaiC 1 [Deltaproteobacteria bacterium CG23_combo_of_CG06-09_8_20_14_all_51_20]PIY21670.1 MAG: KaiC 1 [Deltaproteobacteria bacterium CG_4_10_14_3_um_filter_51_14]